MEAKKAPQQMARYYYFAELRKERRNNRGNKCPG